MTETPSNPVTDEHESFWVLRRYQAVVLILSGILFGGVALFSRESRIFSTARHYPHRIALTFDDGPHPAFTDRLLQVLKEENAAATFFVVGRQAERYPRLMQAILNHGHEIANHTFNHQNLTTLTDQQVARELEDTRRVIESVAGKKCSYFRPPGGQYNPGTLNVASQEGYRMILWTVFPRDHSSPSAQKIYECVMADAQDGGVVLLHSGVESTLKVLPQIIRDLRAKGFQFLTISELLDENIDPLTLSVWCRPSPASSTLATTRLTPAGLARGETKNNRT
jgi:peptidoglycan/xylan/chitin deacetylase (PgdA/CDA1 family)